MKIEWTLKANEALERAIEHIAETSTKAAFAELSKIQEETSTLIDFPEIGRCIKADIRALLVGSSYRVIYRIEKDTDKILVLFFQHTRQKSIRLKK